MDILFRKSGFSREPSEASRSDGVRLSIPVFGRLDPIPHDLAHFVIERELDLQNGFLGSIADGAIFEGMHVISGRQPPHAGEHSRTVMKANHFEHAGRADRSDPTTGAEDAGDVHTLASPTNGRNPPGSVAGSPRAP
jgi:hypothetical protein